MPRFPRKIFTFEAMEARGERRASTRQPGERRAQTNAPSANAKARFIIVSFRIRRSHIRRAAFGGGRVGDLSMALDALQGENFQIMRAGLRELREPA